MPGRSPQRSAIWLIGVAALIAIVVVAWWFQGRTPAITSGSSPPSVAAGQIDPESGLPWIAASDLPSQGRKVLSLIDAGGPFPYAQDGDTFRNAERLLPARPRGYYTEYTVRLPGSSDRGPVRIVMGGDRESYYWTTDHYASFSRIRR